MTPNRNLILNAGNVPLTIDVQGLDKPLEGQQQFFTRIVGDRELAVPPGAYLVLAEIPGQRIFQKFCNVPADGKARVDLPGLPPSDRPSTAPAERYRDALAQAVHPDLLGLYLCRLRGWDEVVSISADEAQFLDAQFDLQPNDGGVSEAGSAGTALEPKPPKPPTRRLLIRVWCNAKSVVRVCCHFARPWPSTFATLPASPGRSSVCTLVVEGQPETVGVALPKRTAPIGNASPKEDVAWKPPRAADLPPVTVHALLENQAIEQAGFCVRHRFLELARRLVVNALRTTKSYEDPAALAAGVFLLLAAGASAPVTILTVYASRLEQWHNTLADAAILLGDWHARRGDRQDALKYFRIAVTCGPPLFTASLAMLLRWVDGLVGAERLGSPTWVSQSQRLRDFAASVDFAASTLSFQQPPGVVEGLLLSAKGAGAQRTSDLPEVSLNFRPFSNIQDIPERPQEEVDAPSGKMQQSVSRNDRRILIGIVTSDKMDKTRRVEVFYPTQHPRYGKRVQKRTVCYVHDEDNRSHVGDKVEIMETRPFSKTKHWRLVRIIGYRDTIPNRQRKRGPEQKGKR